jgi:predicted TPR repeat methyltransferase
MHDPDATPAADSAVPTAELLERALRHHQLSQLAQAEQLYNAILARDPNHPDALHWLGALNHRYGKPAIALELIGRAIDLAPNVGLYHYNLGRAHQALGHAERALAAYRQAVTLDPGHRPAQARLLQALLAARQLQEAIAVGSAAVQRWPAAHELLGPLGEALRLAKQFEPAAEVFRRLVQVRPDDAEAWHSLAVALGELKWHHDALAAVREATRLRPDFALAHRTTGVIYLRADLPATAVAPYETALRLDPDNLTFRRELATALERTGRAHDAAEHYREILRRAPSDAAAFDLAALTGGADSPSPATSPPQYVANYFDTFAETFDSQLLDKLGYRGPQLLHDAVQQAIDATSAGPLDVIDLGCGTGLCAPLFKPLARTLTGIDLSANMLAKARERGLYDELVQGELVEMLSARPADYDFAIAADVLIYFGDLAPVFAAVAASLRPGGRLVFNVEADGDAPGYRLCPTRRYVHGSAYLRTAATAAGFNVTLLRPDILRTERDRPVEGFVVLLTLRG